MGCDFYVPMRFRLHMMTAYAAMVVFVSKAASMWLPYNAQSPESSTGTCANHASTVVPSDCQVMSSVC